uniref:ATPase AAA-type core domain-containing protein n=2 Tax=Opuntia streptacantha TaxID=393608 RepID=A0A7C9CSK0_OPUST
MAEDFCHKHLILYPSEAGLRTIIHCAHIDHEEEPFKQWLEMHIKPELENLEKNGTINESSVIFIDNFAGTNELAYMIDNREDFCRGGVANKFKNWAGDMRHAYEKGKYLEQCIGSLIGKLHEFSGEITSLSGTSATRFREAMQELITINGRAVSTAVSLKSVKEALCSSAWGTSDVDRAIKRSKTGLEASREVDKASEGLPIGQEASCPRLESSLECPEIIESNSEGLEIIATVERALLGCGRSECFLLLGLRDDGKKELVNELVKKIADDGVMKIFAIDMSEYSDEHSLFRLKNSPLRTFSDGNDNWNLVEVVRKHPCSVFYFDKIERAHITVYRFLLSMLRWRIIIDDEGNEVDFCRTMLIFGSDCGDKHALAILAGHEGEVDPTNEASSGQEKQESQACQLRFELLCKVDRWVVFNPFHAHQLKCLRSYSVEDLRIRARGSVQYALGCIFSPNFREPLCGDSAVEELAGFSLGSKMEGEGQKCSPGPDFLPSTYASYLSNLPFV